MSIDTTQTAPRPTPPTAPASASQAVSTQIESRRRDLASSAFQLMLIASLMIVLAALLATLASVAPGGLEVLRSRGVADFIQRPFSIRPQQTGVYQGIVGTVTSALIVTLVAFPLGLASAIWIEEYAGDTRISRLINVVIRNLAGVPAIVYGLLGYAIFVAGPFKSITGGRSVLSAGLTLSVLVLPIVIITSAEAIRAVPSSLRDGGYAMGATRWQVTRTLVLPNAIGGILTGTILGLARALGEAAPLILIGAKQSGFSAGNWGDLTGDFTALPVLISDWPTRPVSQWDGVTQALILVTLVIILGINAAGIVLRNRFTDKD
ncbi:MAG: phosphate ABC transporter permease PstA [Microthrixaceae bacterium]|nr:phosphate ABC transporter permease PstA [Microthrixaceae bacterium]